MSCEDTNVYLITSYSITSVILHVYVGKKVSTYNIFTYVSQMANQQFYMWWQKY